MLPSFPRSELIQNVPLFFSRQHKERLLKDPKVRKEYEKLGPEFLLAQSLIRARLKKGWTQAELARRVGPSVRL